MKADNYIKIEFPSRSVNEGFARAAAAAFAAQLDPTMEELGDIKTAVSEAVTNCIVHAYPDELGKITMRLRILEGGELEISIKDTGRGIEDVARAREPLFTTGGEERSGMGFTIMESFMDRLRVRSKPGKGTTVTMTRAIARRGAQALDCLVSHAPALGPGGRPRGRRKAGHGQLGAHLERGAALFRPRRGLRRPLPARLRGLPQGHSGL